METPHSKPYGVPSQALFHSPEAFDTYLQTVRERREKRKMRLFWERAVVKLQSEIALSEEEQDFEIAAELRLVLAEFESLLASLPKGVPFVVPHSEPVETALPLEPAQPLLEILAEPEPALILHSFTELAALVEAEEQSEPEPEEETVVISQEERQALFVRLQGIEQKWEALKKIGFLHPNGERNRVRLFELRALTCDLGAVWAEACAWDTEQEFEGRVRALRENIAVERNLANDKWVCTLFDEEACWTGEEDAFSPENWTDTGKVYRDLLLAQEAWDWYSALPPPPLSQVARQPLMEAIGATQRLSYDFLKKLEAHDNLQNDLKVVLFKDAKDYGQVNQGDGYLKSLHHNLSEANLKGFALGLKSHYETAKATWQTEKERVEKEIAKEEAMKAFEQALQENPKIGQDESRLEEDRATLEPLLEKVLASGVQLSNPKVRDSLLKISPKVLEGDKKYDPLYKAISTKRTKLGLDLPPPVEEEEAEEEISDADYDRDITWARMFVEGRNVLILGGTPRNAQNVCEELTEKLNCASMEWLESKKTDRMTKFRARIKKADVLLVLIKFAGHDMSEMGKEYIEEAGGNFMQLRCGYGVRQIVHQLALHQEQKERRVPTLHTKPNALSFK